MKDLVIAGSIIIFGFSVMALAQPIQGPYAPEWLPNSYGPVFVGAFIVLTQLTAIHAYSETYRKIRTVAGHASRVIIRAAVLFLFSWWIIPAYVPGVPPVYGTINLLHLAFFVYLWGIFAIWFDIFYALYKGEHWLYLGKVAVQDRIFSTRPLLLLALDIALFFSGIYWSWILLR
jgi:hydrogenase-4 membrane subunit HyfE